MSINNTTLQWLNNTNLSAYAKTSLIDAANKSAYLQGLMEESASKGVILTQGEKGSGGGTTIDSGTSGATITLDADWMVKGAGGITALEFASIVGHEFGHAILANGSPLQGTLKYSPEFGLDLTMTGEGVALTAEWIIGRQLGIDYTNSKSFLKSQAGFMNELDGWANKLTATPVSQWVYSKDSNNVSTRFTRAIGCAEARGASLACSPRLMRLVPRHILFGTPYRVNRRQLWESKQAIQYQRVMKPFGAMPVGYCALRP